VGRARPCRKRLARHHLHPRRRPPAADDPPRPRPSPPDGRSTPNPTPTAMSQTSPNVPNRNRARCHCYTSRGTQPVRVSNALWPYGRCRGRVPVGEDHRTGPGMIRVHAVNPLPRRPGSSWSPRGSGPWTARTASSLTAAHPLPMRHVRVAGEVEARQHLMYDVHPLDDPSSKAEFPLQPSWEVPASRRGGWWGSAREPERRQLDGGQTVSVLAIPGSVQRVART
jgi:hypothetical protein